MIPMIRASDQEILDNTYSTIVDPSAMHYSMPSIVPSTIVDHMTIPHSNSSHLPHIAMNPTLTSLNTFNSGYSYQTLGTTSLPLAIPDVNHLNQEAASIEYLTNDAKYIDQKKIYLQENEVEVLQKLITQLNSTPPAFINHHSVRNILKSYFDSQYLKKLTENHRKMTLKGVFIATVIRYLIIAQREDWLKDTRDTFLEKYPEFRDVESKWELLALIRYDRAVSIALNYLQGRGNKQLLLSIGAHLEGSNMQYVTGGQPSPGTKRRVQIFEKLSGVKPVKRAKRGSLKGGTGSGLPGSPSPGVAGSEEGGGGEGGGSGSGKKSSKGGSGVKRGRPPTRHLKYLPAKYQQQQLQGGGLGEANVLITEEGEYTMQTAGGGGGYSSSTEEDDDDNEEEEEEEGEGEEEEEDDDGDEAGAPSSSSGKKKKRKATPGKGSSFKVMIGTPERGGAGAVKNAAIPVSGGGGGKGGKKGGGTPAFGALDLLSRIASEKFQQLDE